MKLGLVGKICSGKDIVCELLSEKNYVLLKFSDILKEQLNILGLENTRENLQLLANALRDAYGKDIMAKSIIKKAKNLNNVIINGIRSIGELEALRKEGYKIVGIICDDKTRFTRLNTRKRFDKTISIEEFEKIESNRTEIEIEHLINISDIKIENNTTVENFKENIKKLLF